MKAIKEKHWLFEIVKQSFGFVFQASFPILFITAVFSFLLFPRSWIFTHKKIWVEYYNGKYIILLGEANNMDMEKYKFYMTIAVKKTKNQEL